MKDKKIIIQTIVFVAVIAILGLSYAYFEMSIEEKNVKDQIVTTGTLKIKFTDGALIKVSNLDPGTVIEKTVTVENVGTLDADYNLVWEELSNGIARNEMKISATCTMIVNGKTSGEACEGIDETPIRALKLLKNVSIAPEVAHKYDIKITFIETNEDQSYNLKKTFEGKLGVEESREITPVYCTFDGDMTQGAEFIKGVYTYRYMQESKFKATGGPQSLENNDRPVVQNSILDDYKVSLLATGEYTWENITADGWGVILTNKDSTDAVTEAPCTYINNKPVVSYRNMFSESQATSINLSNIDTSNVTNMSGMFRWDSNSAINISNIDTSNVTNMESMFSGVSNLTGYEGLNTSKVTDMSYMFEGNGFSSLNLSYFDTSKVANMSYMFSSSNFEEYIGLNSLDISNVTDMSYMFFYDENLTSLDLSGLDTGNVKNMSYLFYGSGKIDEVIGLDILDTSNVTNMEGMFASTNIKIKKLNTSNVTNMSSMFNRYKGDYLDLTSFDTSKVTNMSYMFYQTELSAIDLTSFNSNKHPSMFYMFYNNANLKTIYASDKFFEDSNYPSENTFAKSVNLVGGAGTVYDSSKVDSSYARIDGGTSNPGYFTLKNK